MKNIFLDCGSHHLEGLSNFLENGIIDSSYEIHCFEANPECFLEERIKLKFQHLNITAHNKAVWIKDGYILFNQENHQQSNTGSPTDGRSKIDGWGSSIDEVKMIHPGYSEPIDIESIDFSKFVSELPNDSKIICKIDIEGSEFKVLEKMLEDKSIDKISELYVEFHERFMPQITQEYKSNLISRIKERDIKLTIWM